MIILLKSGRALAFPKANRLDHKTCGANESLVLFELRVHKDSSPLAVFNSDAVAGVITNDQDYADLLGAEWARNIKSDPE